MPMQGLSAAHPCATEVTLARYFFIAILSHLLRSWRKKTQWLKHRSGFPLVCQGRRHRRIRQWRTSEERLKACQALLSVL
jgi:hypothetical protein